MARVRGRSMLPGLRPGDRLLIRYDAPAAAGEVAVARLPQGIIVLKRVERIDVRGVWLASDNAAEGWSSRAHDEPLDPADVLAVALLRIWPRPRLLRRSTPWPG